MSAFDSAENVARYETWFKKNRFAFASEIAAIYYLLPEGAGFEVGIGTGLFAKRLGIRMGNDPSQEMLRVARSRGLTVYRCSGEQLPFLDRSFDYTLMVTTICFLDDPEIVLRECRRVVKPGGFVVIGFVDDESPMGKAYRGKAQQSVFYREASFYTVDQVKKMLIDTGFTIDGTCQTLFNAPDALVAPQAPRNGSGEGSFVVIRGIRIEREERIHEKTPA
ncbi:MAG: class I SAM-dependent methyltransferase [Chitinispirillaceae bacterium]|nr:class I SAM-dependent methyltransferase [Chitinispirillaceae bacterium]